MDHVIPGLDAIRTMLAGQPDLVILGMRPQEASWQFCCQLLTFLDRPLLLLLAGNDGLDRVRGLELGADDCMGKPLLTVELIARVRALLRRTADQEQLSGRSFFVDRDLIVDLARREVRVNDIPVRLTATEFRFLRCFVTHAGEVLSHERLALHVWGSEQGSPRDSIKLYIHQLRQKLEPDPSHPRRIVTRRGEGYLFRRLLDA
ncbi:MAG: response regulator transcription factor [Anaerolineae bacterium]|nr:response regulator transcription factor [Anaerolineae bacterium]